MNPAWIPTFESLRALLGAAQVDEPEAAQRRYGPDTTGASRTLAGAVRVLDRGQVPDVLRMATASGWGVHPISTGRNWGYGSALPVTEGTLLLDLGGLRRIVDFDEELGVVTLEPGVTQGDLAAFLSQRHLDYLVPVTGAGPHCSLLGNALERGYGITPQTDHFGAVTAMEVVLANGQVHRGMLDEAGGPELAKLFRWGLGPYLQGLFSQSGMGVVTEISLALAPRPERVAVALFGLADDTQLEAAVLAIRRAMQRLSPTLGAVNLMNRHRVMSMSAPYPWSELDAQGLIPPDTLERLGRQTAVMPWTGLATLYGTAPMVAAAQHELKRLLSGTAARLMFVTPSKANALARIARWIPGARGASLRRLTESLRSSLDLVNGRPNETALPLAYWRHRSTDLGGMPRHPAADGCGLIWYAPLVPMRPERARRYVQLVKRVTREHGLEPVITFTTLGDRVFDSTVPLLFDRSDAQATARAKACWSDLLAQGRELGCFPYRFPIDGMEALRAYAPRSCELVRQLHEAIHPRDPLAPGRYR
jgi:4-cresol dehydrogenase (hydroxylating)